MSQPRTEKERIYDAQIAPLMTQIIALCKEHKINMAAQFSLGVPEDSEDDGPLWCTTVLPDLDEADERGCERMMELCRVMFPRPFFAAITITGGAKP